MKNIFVWIALIVGVVVVYSILEGSSVESNNPQRAYSSFLKELDAGNVADVTIRDNQIYGNLRAGGSFRTYAPYDPRLLARMENQGVYINVEPSDSGMSPFWAIVINWLPMIVIVGIWIFLMRQMQSGGGRAMGFGRSRAKLLTEKKQKIVFDDVAGVDEAKAELVEIVEYLRDPRKFLRLGGKIPRGVLLVGPPGTGKTLIARAVAGEAHVPFFTISGSDFVEMFVGVGASRVRDMFEQAKKSSPCIVFIDELDAVGRHRGAGLGGGNDEREQTLNQLLVELDGFEVSENVILIAATNRPDVLDPALLRPGRFDRQVVVPNPDINGREKILRVHAKKIPLAANVDLRVIARGTPGFSGADLANLVNEGALLAARRSHPFVTMNDLENAKDKVMMGSERRSMVISDEEKRLTAYHEAGHALATLHSPASDPIHKATIVPRGRALGMVMRLPERDELSYTREKIEANLVVGMGGRVAEELIFGASKITTGASADIKMITDLARKMVAEWGYSEKLGTVRYHENQEEVFLGHSVARTQNISEATAQMIDSEVRRIIDEAYKTCREIIATHREQLENIAEALLLHETLSGQEISIVANGGVIERPSSADDEDPDLTERRKKGVTMPDTDGESSSSSSSSSADPDIDGAIPSTA